MNGFPDEPDAQAFPITWTFPWFPCKARGVASTTTGNLSDRARAVLGHEVRAARIRAGLPRIDDLAEASGVSRKTIGKLEGGQPVAERSIVALEPHLGWPANEWMRKVEEAIAYAEAGDGSIATDPNFADWRAEEERKRYLLAKITAASRELAAAAEELSLLELGDRDRQVPPVTALPSRVLPGERLAAYETGTVSYRETFDAAQDEAAEAPDAPGPEHGA